MAGLALGQALGGGLLSAVGSLGSQVLSYQMQRGLNQSQYTDYINAARGIGMTPAAIAGGLSKGPMSMPSAPVGQVGAGDIGNVASSLMDSTSSAQLRDEERRNKIKEGRLMDIELMYSPKKWFADIAKTWSEVSSNYSKSDLDKGLLGYYNELKENVVQKRPWEISLLKQGLLNAQKEFDKILSDIEVNKQNVRESQSRIRVNDSQVDVNRNLANLYGEQSVYWHEKTLYQKKENFKMDFENIMRRSGWDPLVKPWDNVTRFIFTDPMRFKSFLSMTTQSLNILDNKLMDNLGKNYKRNIGLAVGMHYVNNRLGEHKTNQLQRINLLTGSVGNLIPFASPAGVSSKVPYQNHWHVNDYSWKNWNKYE